MRRSAHAGMLALAIVVGACAGARLVAGRRAARGGRDHDRIRRHGPPGRRRPRQRDQPGPAERRRPHVRAAPADIRTLAGARVVVMNGLGLDDWLRKAVDLRPRHGARGRVGRRTCRVSSPRRARIRGPRTRTCLDERRVRRAATWTGSLPRSGGPTRRTPRLRSAGGGLSRRLDALDASIATEIARSRPTNRQARDLPRRVPVLRPGATGSRSSGSPSRRPGQDPSAAYTAQLIDAIKAAGVKAIFSEASSRPSSSTSSPPRPARRSWRTSTTTRSATRPSTTYEASSRWDVDQLVAALAMTAPDMTDGPTRP